MANGAIHGNPASFIALADIETTGLFVKLDATTNTVAVAGSGDTAIGVFSKASGRPNDVTVAAKAGDTVAVTTSGSTWVVAGGAVAIGDSVGPDANGKATVVADTGFVSLDGGVAGDIIEVRLS